MLVFIVSGFFACQSKDSETIAEPSAAVDLRPNVRVESVEEQVFVRTLSLPANSICKTLCHLGAKSTRAN